MLNEACIQKGRVMRTMLGPVFLLLGYTCAGAAVVNVEFKFTPFTGDPAKANQVETVPGKAKVFINNVPIAEQPVDKKMVPVMFDEREIAPAVWIPMASMGSVVRRGKNTIRIEFVPSDPKAAYRAQLRWASVTDGQTQNEKQGQVTSTNQAAEGVDDRPATGKSVFEREFTADFAKDFSWHHYPPVSALTDADKQQLVALAKMRVDAFRPNFAQAYNLLNGNSGLAIAEVQKRQCFEKAYAAGVRVSIPSVDQLDFSTSGNPEVVVTRRAGAALFGAVDEKTFAGIKNEEAQMCAMAVISVAFPERLVVVRAPTGAWETVY